MIADDAKLTLISVVGEKQRCVILSKGGIVGMFHPIFPAAHHPDDKGLAAVQNISDLSEGHVFKIGTEVAVSLDEVGPKTADLETKQEIVRRLMRWFARGRSAFLATTGSRRASGPKLMGEWVYPATLECVPFSSRGNPVCVSHVRHDWFSDRIDLSLRTPFF